MLDPNRKAERRPQARARSRRPRRQGPRPGRERRARVARAVRLRGPVRGRPRGAAREGARRPAAGRLAGRPALKRRAGAGARRTCPALLARAAEQGLLARRRGRDGAASPRSGAHGASPGRTGELRDELRVERARRRPACASRAGSCGPNRGWELQEAPVLLPAERFLGALDSAAGAGCSRQAIRWSSDHLACAAQARNRPGQRRQGGRGAGRPPRPRSTRTRSSWCPTFADVEHAQRELAERGAIFGARVHALRLAVPARSPRARASPAAARPTSSAS